MYYTYVIQSTAGKYYIGSTDNIKKRLYEHNAGLSYWTKRYHGWELVYFEVYKTRTEALIREKYLKRLKGGRAFYKIIDRKKPQ